MRQANARQTATAVPSPACGGRCPKGGWGASDLQPDAPNQLGGPEMRQASAWHTATAVPSPACGGRCPKDGWGRLTVSPTPLTSLVGRRCTGQCMAHRNRGPFSRLRGKVPEGRMGALDLQPDASGQLGGPEMRQASAWHTATAFPSPACGGRCPKGGWGRLTFSPMPLASLVGRRCDRRLHGTSQPRSLLPPAGEGARRADGGRLTFSPMPLVSG
ncbi:hypothetical protein FHR55_003850 [Xanthomonas arboricola]